MSLEKPLNAISKNESAPHKQYLPFTFSLKNGHVAQMARAFGS